MQSTLPTTLEQQEGETPDLESAVDPQDGTTLAQVSGDMTLNQFIESFGSGLLEAVRRQNPPIHDGGRCPRREVILDGLTRKPFTAQRQVVQSIARLLLDEDAPAGIINGEMGSGKTMMAIGAAAVCHAEGLGRTLVISPPHLVYKWRREILQTVPGAKVTVLNGPDTLRKLIELRNVPLRPSQPEFYVMGRVRMRMGYHWRPAFALRRRPLPEGKHTIQAGACPECGAEILGEDQQLLSIAACQEKLAKERCFCACGSALWTLMRAGDNRSQRDLVKASLQQLPTIGDKAATRLLDTYGESMLAQMLGDNVYEFINLMDEDGELYFSDRQARRMERAMANMEFGFGQGGYQPTEFIKRYLPQGFFGLLVVDEGHEYKNEGSAQGQAMGVLARKCRKTLLLTGTLMGGYSTDLFYLLWRLNPQSMMEDGFHYNKRGSLGSAAMAFMREHGVVKDIYRISDKSETQAHRTARGKAITHRTAQAPGFGPAGIMRFVVPITAFLRLKDIGGAILPPYREHFEEVAMDRVQGDLYRKMANSLKDDLRQALRAGDHSLMGVVLNVLLAWPDCCFRPETVRHPHRNRTLASLPALYGDGELMPKERALLDLCRKEKSQGRRVLVYTVYTGTRDTTSRLKGILEQSGFKVGVLRASVDAVKREDWLAEQVDRGVEIIITNPDLVKTGLDMLEFATIAFMQSGYNVYTLQQAARRSWRIGQKEDVDVYYFGYAESAQMACLSLMAKKIAVSQSTSGDMPESGLDVLNQSGDSIEVALAKQLVS